MPTFVPDTGGVTQGPTGRFVPDAPAGKKKKGGGFLHDLAKYSGAEFVGHAAKDVGEMAIGIVPAFYGIGKAMAGDIEETIRNPWVTGKEKEALLEQWRHPRRPVPEGAPHAGSAAIGQAMVNDYIKRYGPLAHGDVGKVAREFYEHPAAYFLDAASLGAAGLTAKAVAAGKYGERGTIVTRSPRAVAEGEAGAVQTKLTSASPFARAREEKLAKLRAARTKRMQEKPSRITEHLPGGLKTPGEFKAYGKGIQAEAQQAALLRMHPHDVYTKATKKLSDDEWGALHIRALDIHPDDLAELWKGTPNEWVTTSEKARHLALHPDAKIQAAETAARHLSSEGEKLLRGSKRLKEEAAKARPGLSKKQASEALGRPVRSITGNPYYITDVPIGTQKAVSPLAIRGGGGGPARAPGSAKRNLGKLFLSGRMHVRSDVLGPEFLKRVKFVKYDEIHNGLVRGAVRVTDEDLARLNKEGVAQVPKGWQYVRQHHREKKPLTMRGETEEHVPLSELIPNPGDLQESQLAQEGFMTTTKAEAHGADQGVYHIVPKSMGKAATGEFTKSNEAVHMFVKKPLAVWRALVLGLRPGFLTNNIVGTSLMYAASRGGKGAMRDLFGAFMETHGPQVGKKLLDHPSTPPALRRSLYEEFFPEQMQAHGTFGGTQSPAVGATAASKALRTGEQVTAVLPKASGTFEAGARKATIRGLIRNSPEFRSVYKMMPRQTRSFEGAARQLLEGKGSREFQRRISKEVNDALGSYMNMSSFERNVLRNSAPFYAWYKAITTTAFHLAADTPLRANILGHIGQLGKEQSEAALGEVPSFLKGAIRLGAGAGGTVKVLATQGANPWATLEQLRRGATTDITDLGLNPFAMAGIEGVAHAKHGIISPAALAAGGLAGIGRDLPLTRVAFPKPPSALYPNRNRISEILGWLGAPVKEYRPGEARAQAREGR